MNKPYLNNDIEYIEVINEKGETIVKINDFDKKQEITGKENASVCIKYIGTDVKTIIHL